MAEITTAPYGSWATPLTADLIVSETVKLGQLALDGDRVYWVEGRPGEGGRNVVMSLNQDEHPATLTPAPFNVRTRVHEYGGGAFCVSDGVIYFSNFSDQRLYRQLVSGDAPQPLTSGGEEYFADGIMDRQRNRLILVREDHACPDGEPVNSLVSLPLDSPNGETHPHEADILISGHDFYSSPCLSPDGRQLAWLAWNHPNMPWDGTELWVGTVDDTGAVRQPRCVAGGVNESIFQPAWSPDGRLYCVSDRSGWWNLYRWDQESLQSLCPMEAEFGLPQWVFGLTTYGFESADSVLCTYTQNGVWKLGRLTLSSGHLHTVHLPYTELSSLHVSGNRAVCVGSSPVHPTAILSIHLDNQAIDIVRSSTQLSVDEAYLSIPEPLSFRTEDGDTAHAFFYPPRNADFQGPSHERPPLLVKSHGGPTGQASTAFNLMIQFWTSRGFAVLDVNYRGSTGYGRAYRDKLQGQWGVIDVIDCVSGIHYLRTNGMIDPDRVTITGGSAGGYTTLCALTFTDCFTAGSSYYGVSDLEALVRETHKFESRYLDQLVGPYPEARALYVERSPIHFTDRLACPLILFQGLDDKIVPPNQAEQMFEAVRRKGLPVAYLAFEGEQHGFRRADTIKRVLHAELYFYSKIFRFKPAEDVPPIPIENLPS